MTAIELHRTQTGPETVIERLPAEKAAARELVITTGQPARVLQIDVQRAEPAREWELEL